MYTQVFELHSQLHKALAHPRRLEIVNLLRYNELYVTDIYQMLDLPQANISHHLMILRKAGVVSTIKEGKQVRYKIANMKIVEALDLLRDVLIHQHKDSAVGKALLLTMNDLVPIVHDPVCSMRLSPRTAGGTFRY